jgi:hypothetical protein
MMADTPNAARDTGKETGEIDKEAVRSAKELLQSVAKTTKTLKIYLPNNPIHKKFLSDLKGKFDAHLKRFGPLRMKVRQFEFLCGGAAVYENINRLESLAFRLFTDGVREIVIDAGLSSEEIVQFIEILGKESEHGADDDAVTLLWEMGFTHIHYLIAEDGQGNPSLDSLDSAGSNGGAAVPAAGEQIRAMVEQEVSSGQEPAPAPLLSQEPAESKVEVQNLSVFQLDEKEVERIKLEVHQEQETDLIQKILDILFDILRIEREPVLFAEVTGIVDNILNALMMRGDFFHARRVMEFYWEMTDPAKALPPALAERLVGAIRKAGEEGRVRALEPVLNNEQFDDTENFFAFLVLLEKNAVGPLADLLGHASKMKVRRTLCDALVELGKMDLEMVISKLELPNWHIVRNLVYVLGKIGDPRVLQAFHKVKRHREARVRKELVSALDGIDEPKGYSLLMELLQDPDGGIRIAALKSLARRNHKETPKKLLSIIAEKGFEERDFDEKKEFFDAIGRISGNEVIPQMRRLLLQKGILWLRNARQEEMGICSALALQRIGSAEAIEALREGGRNSGKTVREACLRALDTLGQTL